MKKNLVQTIQEEELFTSFINQMPLGIIITDIKGVVKEANDLALMFLNQSHSIIVGARILEFVTQFSELESNLTDCYQNKCTRFVIDTLLHNGRYYMLSGKTIYDGYMIVVEDITKQKELELNSIQAILESQETERRRIGREIHDGIGPLLSTIKLSLDSLKDDIRISKKNASIDSLDGITNTIDSITYDLRSITQRLVPRLLEEFGLFVAFENLIFKINETKKFTIKFYCNFGKDSRFDSEIELNLFRCGQELINNAVKYSKANSILVQIILHSESIVLMVEDDGVGFNADIINSEETGIGLTNIETRVRVLNGEFNIDSILNKGTVASIEIPVVWKN